MGGKTPDRFPGSLIEEEVIFEASLDDPTATGALRFVGGSFRLRDSMGVFDPRTGGTGLTEAQHEALDRLTHEINETSFDEIVYDSRRVTQYIVWASAAKLLKIREELYTYNSGRVSQVVTIQYDGLGVEKERLTEVYTYSGANVTSVTRTKA